jgi:hypothetical protein
VLQRRPNTFAQTILSLSFFACDKAADHTFRFARDTAQTFGTYLPVATCVPDVLLHSWKEPS